MDSANHNEIELLNMYNSMDLGVIFINTEGKIISANKKAGSLFNFICDQNLNRFYYQYQWNTITENGKFLPAEKHPIMIALKTGKPILNEVMGMGNQNEPNFQWFEVNSFPEFRKNETIPYKVFATFLEITQRKKSEQEFGESEENLKTLNNLTLEMLELPDLYSIQSFIVNTLQKRNRDTIILFNSIDEEKNDSCLEIVSGIKNGLLQKVFKIIGFNPVGKKYKLIPTHNDYFRSGKFVEFKNGIVAFSKSALPDFVAKTIGKLIGLNKIYTIGILKEKTLLASIHFFTFNNKEITEINFIESFIIQSGVVLQKKIADYELIASEEKYRMLAENMKDVVWIVDTNTMFYQYISPSVFKLLGFSTEEVIIQPFINCFSPCFQNEIKESILLNKSEFLNGKVSSETHFVFESEQTCKNGSFIWTEVVYHFWNNPKTKSVEMHGVTRDITLRKTTEEALRKSETRLNRAEITSKSGNWELHLDTLKINASEGAAKIYGFQRECFEYEEIKKSPLPEYRQKLDFALKNLIEKSEPYDLEFKIKTADSAEIKDIHSVAVFDTKKKVLFGIIQDITAQKQTEARMRESEKSYFGLFNSVAEAIYIQNKKGVFIDVNASAEKMCGYCKNELIGKTTEFLSAKENEDFLIFPSLLEKVFTTGEPLKMEFWGKKKNGEIFPQDVICQKGKYFGNEVIITTSRDISERYQIQKVLKESEAHLLELNATKDKFFSIVAHDLKSPFNSILGFSNLLIEEVKNLDIETIEQYAGIINSSAKHSFKLLENLLEWAMVQQGKIPFSPREMLLNQIVNDEFQILKSFAFQKNIELDLNINQKIILSADENMLRTCLRNIISNAIKFTPKNGKIIVAGTSKGNKVEISVQDNGIGMTKDSIEKLFRIETSFSTRGTENEKGTGLGLLLCKEFIAKHGGNFWVESTPGKGSNFQFTLPQTEVIPPRNENGH